MFHCGGGDGPNAFDSIGTLEQWVEKRKTPERIVAAHWTDGKADRSRPLCRFPNIAVYKGVGITNDAANFVCRHDDRAPRIVGIGAKRQAYKPASRSWPATGTATFVR